MITHKGAHFLKTQPDQDHGLRILIIRVHLQMNMVIRLLDQDNENTRHQNIVNVALQHQLLHRWDREIQLELQPKNGKLNQFYHHFILKPIKNHAAASSILSWELLYASHHQTESLIKLMDIKMLSRKMMFNMITSWWSSAMILDIGFLHSFIPSLLTCKMFSPLN